MNVTICSYLWSNVPLYSQAVLFVYDITNQSTFDNLEDWWQTVKYTFKAKEPNSLPSFALVANKGLWKRLFMIVNVFANHFCMFLVLTLNRNKTEILF